MGPHREVLLDNFGKLLGVPTQLQPRYSGSNSLTSCLKVHVLSARPHVAISIKPFARLGEHKTSANQSMHSQ